MVKRILLILTTVLTLVVLTAHAQIATGGSYTITQSVIASGGGASSSVGPNIFSITGTGGQSLAGGPISNAPYNFFSGFWTSAALTITPAAPLSIRQGSAVINSQIATVNDPNQAANTLSVTATPLTGSGVAITGISIDGAGNVTANVVANCTAVSSTFTLNVMDNAAATGTATLIITVNGNAPPTLTYSSPQSAVFG